MYSNVIIIYVTHVTRQGRGRFVTTFKAIYLPFGRHGKQRDMLLLVEIDYILPDILQMNLLTWLYFVKLLRLTPKISHQWIKVKNMVQDSVMNELMFTNGHISCLWETRA